MGILITCRDASRLLSQMQDAELPLAKRAAVRLHLAFCGACTRFAAQLRFLRVAMRRYSR